MNFFLKLLIVGSITIFLSGCGETSSEVITKTKTTKVVKIFDQERIEKWKSFKSENFDLALFHKDAYPQRKTSMKEVALFLVEMQKKYKYKPDVNNTDIWSYMDGFKLRGDCEDWSITFTNDIISTGILAGMKISIDSGLSIKTNLGHAWVEIEDLHGQKWVVDCDKAAVYDAVEYQSKYSDRLYLYSAKF